MWDEYKWLKDTVDSGRYGKVISGVFKRNSAKPDWAWENWLHQPEKSGNVALDMHIHDLDFVRYLMGEPSDMHAFAARNDDGTIGHMFTLLSYGKASFSIDVCWDYPPTFPFSMAYRVRMDKATVVFDSAADPSLVVFTADGRTEYPKIVSAFVATNATFYVGSVWLISYATTTLGYDRTTILSANAALSLSDIPMILAFGLLSDYIGRRKMFLTGMAGLALFAVPYFMLVSTANIWLFILGSLIVQACRCAVYGPQSAYFAEQFSTRMRYSGSSLAYQFAAILGGMAPLICTALVAMTGSVYSVAALVVGIALVSLTCSYLMTETLRTGLATTNPLPL
jgi:hypothetical protein